MATGQWTDDIGLKLYKNIRLDINKYSQYLATEYMKSAQAQLRAWESNVYDVLSDPLPASEWHKKRDPSRLYPHMNTGKQLSTIDSGVRFKVTGAGNFSITSWAVVGTVYSEYTNQGYKRRKDGVKPQWIGWLTRIFKGGAEFISVDEIFDLLTLERQGLNG
jgi:hypothetical protein